MLIASFSHVLFVLFFFLLFHFCAGQTESSNNQLSHQTEAKSSKTVTVTNESNTSNVGVNAELESINDTNASSPSVKCNVKNSNETKHSTNDNSNGKHCDISIDEIDKDHIIAKTNEHLTENQSEKLSAANEKATPFGLVCDKTLSNGHVTTPRLNGGESTKSRSLLSPTIHTKKAVSLEKIDETVKKFISGEIIIDKENPFKKLNAKRRADFFSSTPANLQKTKESTRVTFAVDTKHLPKDEFITKEEVLKESKYVKTYIKHPDEYFVYDPTLKERLLREEQLELAAKNRDRNSPPRKPSGTRISKSTQERLRELKNRYSPSNLNYNCSYSQPKPRTILTNGHANGYIASKLPTLQIRKDRSKYPDLSQIKVKTGTDLEGSLFNPKEVAINAKKFDARIKNTQFGSQDDLDEITDLTSDFDANGFDVIDTCIEDKPKEKKTEETLTTTITSKEFQKYLAEKGLVLQPQLRIIETSTKMATPITQNETDAKKSRKPSVLQRLFPNGFFSSRRRTTPKEAIPSPINVQANEPKKSGRLASARRLVLHRQSMPANCVDYATKSNLKQTSALSGSSSSISSTLTNVENSEYLESYRANCNKSLKSKSNDSDTARSLSGLRYIDSSSNSTIVTCDKNKNSDQQIQQSATKPIPRPRQLINGKPATGISQSTPMLNKSYKETPNAAQKIKSSENRDRECGIKTRARPKIPISNLRPLVNHRTDGKSDQMDEKRVNGLFNDAVKVEQKRRIASKLPERLNKVPVNVQLNKRNLCEMPFEIRNDAYTNRNDAKTPDTVNDSKAPASTSTPITEGQPPKFNSEIKTKRSPNTDGISLEQSLNISPIPKRSDTLPRQQVNMDAATWAKVQELKQKTDRQLYSQPLLVQAHVNTQPTAFSPRIIEQPHPIYDRLPAHNINNNNNMVASQPLYAKVEKKPSSMPINAQFVRNAPYRQSLDQIRLHAAHQHQQQQLQQLQQQQLQQQQQQQQTVNPAMFYQQPIFIRNSPQRNTIGGVYRGNMMQRISPQIPQTPITIAQTQQPQRPQSVLDEMMTGRAAPSSNVQMRRNPLSRSEIMNQVIEFCRKSMNRTPTKFFRGISNEQVATIHRDATSSEVSPISYSSVTPSKTSPSIASSRSGKIGPQVPIRKQSLPPQISADQIDQHPIYEHIPKQNAHTPSLPMVNDENKPVNGIISHYAVPPKRYIVVDGERLTPTHVKQYQQMNGSHSSLNQPVYIQSAALKTYGPTNQDINPYEYVRVRRDSNSSLGNNLLQIYHPNTALKPINTVVDRRFTPIILPTIPQHQQINGNVNNDVQLPPGYTKTKVVPKHGRIVMLNNIEQMYRPIAVQAKHVRYQTSQTSLDSRQSSDTIDSIHTQKHQVIMQSKCILLKI